jgi:hypothetical protein
VLSKFIFSFAFQSDGSVQPKAIVAGPTPDNDGAGITTGDAQRHCDQGRASIERAPSRPRRCHQQAQKSGARGGSRRVLGSSRGASEGHSAGF